MVNTHIIGQTAEDMAAEYLIENKLRIIDRNYRTRFGEIDIISKEKKKFVFVEVKAKNTSRFGKPYEMVTAKKQKKLISTAKGYLTEIGLDIEKIDWRIDVISIDYETGTIEWLKNAVEDI
ncbi:MAG: YraN family protein [bacterium]|nr:YraN family protein [bacterium]